MCQQKLVDSWCRVHAGFCSGFHLTVKCERVKVDLQGAQSAKLGSKKQFMSLFQRFLRTFGEMKNITFLYPKAFGTVYSGLMGDQERLEAIQ